MKASSGTTAIATTTASATDVIPAASTSCARHARIISAVAGFFSLDGGTTWDRIPANTPTTSYDVFPIARGKIKRDGVTDMTGVDATVWVGRSYANGYGNRQTQLRRGHAPVRARLGDGALQPRQ